MQLQSDTFQGKARFDGKKPNWNTLAKSKNIRRPKAYHKLKTVVKSSVKWDASTGKCSFMSIFGVLVATGLNCFIVLWKILVLWRLNYRSISWSPKGCKNSQNNADQVFCLMTSLIIVVTQVIYRNMGHMRLQVAMMLTWSSCCMRNRIINSLCRPDSPCFLRVMRDYQSYWSLGGLHLCKSGCLINFVTLRVGAFQCTQPSFHELL